MNTVDPIVGVLAFAKSREDVNLVSASVEGRGQLSHMWRDTANGYGVESLPSKHRDPHREIS
jgi:hypothetical protein